MKQLAMLAEQDHLAPIDVQLAGLLARRAAAALPNVEQVRVVAATGALLSAARARGHSCLDLTALAGEAPWEGVELRMPEGATWREILRSSGLCGDGTQPAPLVLDGDRLYLYRYHAAERRLSAALRARLSPDLVSTAQCAPETVAFFRRLFPSAGDATDWQAVSAAAAMRSGITVITGGPGTGKTTTVAKVLALLLHQRPTIRIAIAAPTGKAAARLGASIAVAAVNLPAEIAVKLPREARTLHRLLGYQPWNDRFAHDAQHPLGDDVIVVDEASMVDVLLMDALFSALRPSARVILLGDQDQLASVDTGSVLGDVCRAAEACGDSHGAGLCASYERLSGQSLSVNLRATPLRDAVVRLRRSYRFEQQPGIGAVAEAVRLGRAAEALEEMDASRPDVDRRDRVRDVAELLAPVQDAMDAYLAAPQPADALRQLACFRVLCALREGPYGVTGLTADVERLVFKRGIATRTRWYERRPILVTANDPSTRLYNGDVGVVMPDATGRPMAWFEDATGGVRAVAPSRLPAHETAWAMTVHKSQGSEFGQVLLVLPEEPSPVVTRELLYTAVTRARQRVSIVGTRECVIAAIDRTTTRTSGLAARLAE